MDILRRVGKHAAIVELLDVFEDAESVQLVLEFVPGGELFDRIISHGQYTEAEAAYITCRLAVR